MKDGSLIFFASILSGKFSNKEQSQESPKDFAHINIYFRPLPWSLLKMPAFYSEQSYDYSPWTPYRQGVHILSKKKEIFIVENFSILDADRFAGGGFNSEILKPLNKGLLTKRAGCSMHFTEIKPGSFQGKVEPGNKCLIERDGRITYLASNVELGKGTWISLDQGFDRSTHQHAWGSNNGPLRFKRVSDLSNEIKKSWIKRKPNML